MTKKERSEAEESVISMRVRLTGERPNLVGPGPGPCALELPTKVLQAAKIFPRNLVELTCSKVGEINIKLIPEARKEEPQPGKQIPFFVAMAKEAPKPSDAKVARAEKEGRILERTVGSSFGKKHEEAEIKK